MSTGRSIGILTALNGVGTGLGVFDTVVVARAFGVSGPIAIFSAAQRLDQRMANLTQSGQIAEILLPLYLRIKHERGPAEAQRAFAVVVNWFLLAVVALSVLAWFAAPLLLWVQVPGWSGADRAAATGMFRWIIPLLGLQIALNLVKTYVNAESRFGAPETFDTLASAVGVALIVLLARPLGIMAMVASLWGTVLVQMAGHLWVLRRLGYRHHFALRHESFSAWSVFRNLFLTFGYVGATQVYGFGLDAALSMLPQSIFAVFTYYVQRIYEKTNGIVLRPISVVFFTAVAQALAKGAANVRALARDAMARYLMLAALVVAVVAAVGEPLLAGLWGGRDFGPDRIRLAARLLALLYLLLLPTAMGLVVRKTMISLGLLRQVYLSTTLVQVVSGGVAWAAAKTLNVGLAGVIVIIAGNMILLWLTPFMLLLRSRRDLAVFVPLGSLARWAGVAAAAVGAAWLLHRYAALPLAGTRSGHFIEATVLATVVVAIMLAGAWLLNVAGFRRDMLKIVERLLGRRGIRRA